MVEYIKRLPKFPLEKLPLTGQSIAKDDIYGEGPLFPGVYDCHEFQLKAALCCGGKILNAACSDDPPGLGKHGAINLDVMEKQEWIQTGGDLAVKDQNFVKGSILDPPFTDEQFDTVVLGEFLEHCVFDTAVLALCQCRRVVKVGGHVVVTFPLDARPREEQFILDDLKQIPLYYDEPHQITAHHQTWWTQKMIRELKRATRLVEIARVPLLYMLTAPIGGWGLVLKRP
jgi:predicted SAM-dependent methyltransferase